MLAVLHTPDAVVLVTIAVPDRVDAIVWRGALFVHRGSNIRGDLVYWSATTHYEDTMPTNPPTMNDLISRIVGSVATKASAALKAKAPSSLAPLIDAARDTAARVATVQGLAVIDEIAGLDDPLEALRPHMTLGELADEKAALAAAAVEIANTEARVREVRSAVLLALLDAAVSRLIG